ncbi:hypothetical protein ACIPVK_21150 [Paeniglutamicibacter sp. MACA_103]
MIAVELLPLPADYDEVVAALKNQAHRARVTAQRRVNTELIAL